VRWVWIDPSRTQNVDWTGFMSVSFEDEGVIIGELDPGLCN